MEPEAQVRRIDLELVFDWVKTNTKRWSCANPIGALDDEADAEAIRQAAIGAIPAIAAQMANAKGRGARDATRTEVAEWLGQALDDATSAPDGLVDGLLVEPITPGRTARCTPLRRWCAALREQVQATGAVWYRGRHAGTLAFAVGRLNGHWTITEHGETTDDSALRNGMIAAVSYALGRIAQERGKQAFPERAAAKRFRAAADAYEGNGGQNG